MVLDNAELEKSLQERTALILCLNLLGQEVRFVLPERQLT